MCKYGVGMTTMRKDLEGLLPTGSEAMRKKMKIVRAQKKPEPKPEPVKEVAPRSVHSPVKVYHITDLSPSEQERIMNLNDRYRTDKKPVGGWAR